MLNFCLSLSLSLIPFSLGCSLSSRPLYHETCEGRGHAWPSAARARTHTGSSERGNTGERMCASAAAWMTMANKRAQPTHERGLHTMSAGERTQKVRAVLAAAAMWWHMQ
jgi:hypothetical protein